MNDTTAQRAAYTVVGAGAIGGTLAFALADAGHPVTVVDADAAHVAAIRAGGLVVARGGTRSSVPVTAVTPDEFEGTLGRVLLAVKAQATGTAVDWIAPRLAPDGYVVSLQNGFNEAVIAERVGAGRTVAAFVNIFADVVEPGVVLDGGAGALVIGEPDGAPVSARVRDLVADLQSWGPAVASDNVEGYLWAKAGFGAMLAATALADAPMADLIDRHRPAMAGLTGEIFAVADRLGVTLEPFDAFEPLPLRRAADPADRDGAFDRLTAWLRTQSKDRSGIWRDLAVRNRPVEVTTHYADVFAHADRAGLPTPLLRAVVDGLRGLEGAPQGMAESRLDVLDRLALAPERATAVGRWLDEHREELVADLADYTSVGSASDDPDALDACLVWLRDWLDRRLGAPDAEEILPRAEAGDILVRRYPARDAASADTRPVLLLGHYDTVWPTGTLDTWPFERDGDRITGPGVFDMKAGLVQAVWALRALDALGLPRPACTLMLNGDEETGSLASSGAIVDEARGSRLAMVFEAAADGAVKTARKGVGLFTLTVTGSEAHAGLDPTAGASAVDELAHQILRLGGLRDHAAGTSLNVGVVEGGTRSNVTAGRAVARLDVRVASEAERLRVTRALAELTPVDARTRVEITGDWNRPVFERTAQVAALAELARRCAGLLGHDLAEASVGGASDGNFVAAAGVPVLDGIGALGSGAHARSENTSVSGLVGRAALAATVLGALADD
ncbi:MULTISPECIES: 2-dehydropantoate 2-reductase [Streptomyces]|uniref:2-dehydropantoate 2-reductase n=1 Tax=Streptomyces doudnae TaxID=3075536 RepID=A0ABD5EWQ0_9ACTN|nr:MULTISPECIES: 2-dehydropantoate 2-reductase [unclassified Streptomyces]MDT0439133.1 2-dehydropantoate 2-reductase [Streptomyces sp. DSM 41981]MYQ67199.1 2-dehydropantoate 2-reductase [Streptomyces sp. SID4950]SCE31313.1 glutamate carboxypeptidase [Streptomyces sp. SolWspMP-5a-2]